MDNIYKLPNTNKTPSIIFNKSKGILEIKGYSIPSDTVEFYSNLKEHIIEYIKNPAEETHLHLHIEYMNTSSSKMIFQLVSLFEKLNDMGKVIDLNWHIDDADTDMLDIGKVYQHSLKFATNIIEVNE